jgi:hypothetical protein
MEPQLKALKELGEYLGKKLDLINENVRKGDSKVEVNMGELSNQKIADTIENAVSPFVQNTVESQAETLRLLDQIGSALGELNKCMDKMPDAMQMDAKTLAAIKNPEVPTLLKEAIKAVKAIKIPEQKPVDLSKIKPTDTSRIEQGLRAVQDQIDAGNAQIKELFTKLTEAIAAISLKVPDTFKLDDMQIRAISTSRMPLNPAPLAPRRINVVTVSASSANTEYSRTLSAGTTGYFIKLRAQNVILYMASATGKLPTSGDGSAYMTIPQSGYLSPMGMDVGGKTLYFNTPSASQTIEIVEYIA